MNIKLLNQPHFRIGDTAWGVSRGSIPRVQEVQINGVRWVELDAGFVHTGYKGSAFNFSAPNLDDWEDHELYENRDEAEKLCARTEIDVESIDWQKMIGDREDESHYDSELGVCCADISGSRDIIIASRKDKAICTRDIELLEQYIIRCAGYEFFDSCHPELDKFFKMIGIPRNE